MDLLETLKKLPRRSYAYYPESERVIRIHRGESGYYPCDTEGTPEFLNAQIGVTKYQAEAMLNGSLFGWNAPGADPDYLRLRDGGMSHDEAMRQITLAEQIV